jgi:hypothetical protein
MSTRPLGQSYWSIKIGVGLLTVWALTSLLQRLHPVRRAVVHIPFHAEDTLARCRVLDVRPSPPEGKRTVSDRYVPGEARPVLIKNATIWTGNKNGTEVVKGDLLLENGLIKEIGHVNTAPLAAYSDYSTVDARGSWITPG